jgi:hypothetical protein
VAERQYAVKRTLLNLAIVFIALFSQIEAQAQTRGRNAPAAPPTLMSSLPESDAVAQIKVKQLMNEAMPRILAGNPAKLSEVNASIDRFKDRTGLDPRMFEQIALGVRFTLSVRRRDEGANCRTCEWKLQCGGDGCSRSSGFERKVSRRKISGQNHLHLHTRREHQAAWSFRSSEFTSSRRRHST